MNIVYNCDVDSKAIELFRLVDEFVYTNLTDKKVYYKITIHFKESEDKSNGLSYIGRLTIKPAKPYQPIIKISDYAIRLSANAYELSGKKEFNTFASYKLRIIFHELAHLIRTYNDPYQFEIMIRDNESYFDKGEEDKVNKLSMDFLRLKNLI